MRKPFLLSILLLPVLATQAQSEHYQVYALRFASMGYRCPTSYWATGPSKTDTVDIEFMVWLIKGSNGKNILVDAGFRRDMIHAKDAEEFKIKNYRRPDSALSKLGLKAGDITDIILSHPHWDHADGLGLFPHAHIWVQKDDYNYFVGGAWQKGGMSGGFQPRDVRLLVDLNMAGRVTLVDGDDKEIIPGIKVYTGSHHTFNSQFVGVTTPNGNVVLASDNIWVYYSLEHMRPPSEGGTLDTTAYVRSMKRMKTLVKDPKYIIPGHDGKTLTLFPPIAEGIVRIQ